MSWPMHQPSFWWGGCLIAMVSGRDVLPVAVQAAMGCFAEAGLSPGTTPSDLQETRGYRLIVIPMLISAWLSCYMMDTKPRKKTLSIGHQNNPTEFKQFIQSRPQRWVQRGEHSIFPSGYSKPALRAFFSTSAGLAPLKLRVLLASTAEAPNRSRAVIEARVMFFIGKQFLASIYHFHANSRHYFKNLNHSYR